MDEQPQTPVTAPLMAIAHLRNWALASREEIASFCVNDERLTASFKALVEDTDRLLAYWETAIANQNPLPPE